MSLGVLIAAANIWEFPFADACVLVRADSHDFYILNPSAAYAWELLRAGKDITEATRQFADRYGIPADIAVRDLLRAWSEWEQTLLASAPPHFLTRPPSLAKADLPAGAFSRTYSVHGKNIRVVLHDPELIAEIAPRLEALPNSPDSEPDAVLQAAASEAGYQIFAGAECTAVRDHPADARVWFLLELVRLAQANREWAAMLHAAACGSASKCAIFPAATHSGKTTLSAVLMHSGLTLYADDTVALEREGLRIPAMPFSLMIREGSWPVISERYPGFRNLATHERYGQRVKFLTPLCPPEPGSVPACAIVFNRWELESRTMVHSLSAFEALVRLKECGFWIAPERDNIRAFLAWLQSLPAFDLVYSDVDEAAAFVKELLAK